MTARTAKDQTLLQAAQWLARMQNDDRTVADEARFAAWIDACPSHAAAFDHVTHVWDLAWATTGRRKEIEPTRRRLVTALAGVAAVGVGVVGWNAAEARTVRTVIGEQKRLTAPDGTRITLDTDTALVIARRADQRRSAVLKRGRSAFSVLETDGRPFIVEVAAWTLSSAKGDFDVSMGEESAVVVRSGQVQARHQDGRTHLVPGGNRLDLTGRVAPAAVDLEAAQAWRSGQLVFADVRLADAAAALNRYARKPIVVSAALADMRVSGVYRTGSPEAFAEAAAALVGGRTQMFRNRIEVTAKTTTS